MTRRQLGILVLVAVWVSGCGVADRLPGSGAGSRVSESRPARLEMVGADGVSTGGGCQPGPGRACSRDGQETYTFAPEGVRRVAVVRLGSRNEAGQLVVDAELDDAGARTFAELTGAASATRQRLVVMIPGTGEVITAPAVVEPIPGGRLQIAGNFSREERDEVIRLIAATAE